MSGAVGTSQTHFQFYTNNFYAQDDWKITRSLSISYGLRYEYVTPPVAAGIKSRFRIRSSIRQAVVSGAGADSATRLSKPDKTNFAPRLGLAYNPAWAPSWVVRAGAGIYYDQTQMNETQFTTNSPPTFFQQNYNYTGRGLPPAQFGVNTLPITAVPPITTSLSNAGGYKPVRQWSRTERNLVNTCGISRCRSPLARTGWRRRRTSDRSRGVFRSDTTWTLP